MIDPTAIPEDEELTFEKALGYLDRFDSEFQDVIHKIIQVMEHPGWRALLAYMKVDYEKARDDLVKANALDSKEILRLQMVAERFEWLAEAPRHIVRAQVAAELAAEADARQYDD